MTEVAVIRPLTSPPDVTIAVPGSRSITNRALVCAALASGSSLLEGALASDDTEAMVDCLRRLGIAIEVDTERVVVDGCGGEIPDLEVLLHTRLSGTTTRFMVALCALGHGTYRVDSDPPMRSRPMGDLIAALRDLGAEISSVGDGLPLVVDGHGLVGGAVAVRGDASSQFLSGLMLAAPAMRDGLEVRVEGELMSRPYVEMTRRVMAMFGASVELELGSAGHFVRVVGAGYSAASVVIEPDASAACYFWGAAAITGGRVRVDGLGLDSIQGDVRFVDVLEQMGCNVERGADHVTVQGPERLDAVDVDLADISDQAPTLAAVAAVADGTTRVRGVGFIRRKESDRIGAIVTELGRLGVAAHEEDDGFVVQGGAPQGGSVETYDDHRIAMSFALLGLRVHGIEIVDPRCVVKTFPAFFDVLERLRSAP